MYFFPHNDSTEYLPSHLLLLTASLTTATVPAQTLSVCKSVIDHSTSTGRTEIESGVPLFDCSDTRQQEKKKGKTNVQSTRTSVMHLLQSFWFIIDLGDAQHLCCWPPNIVQGHFDSRCEEQKCISHLLTGPRSCRPAEDSKPDTFGPQTHFSNCLGSIMPARGVH